jgi:hypothetical protein
MGKRKNIEATAVQAARQAALSRVGQTAEIEALKEGKTGDQARLVALESRAKFEAMPRLSGSSIDQLFARDQEVKAHRFAAEKEALASGKSAEEALVEGEIKATAVVAGHKKTDARVQAVVFVAILVAVGIFFAMAHSGSKSLASESAARSAAAAVPAVAWWPSGFTAYGDGVVATKWVHNVACQLGDRCLHLQVIAQLGCPNGLYAAINILDKNGTVIDSSNDTVPSLAPRQQARLEFGTYNTAAASGSIATINCSG